MLNIGERKFNNILAQMNNSSAKKIMELIYNHIENDVLKRKLKRKVKV